MAPSPQEIPRVVEEAPRERGSTREGERVVISGMSGAYPRAKNIEELSEILYNKVDPIADSQPRWNYNHPEVPNYIGLIPDLNKFDGQFFKVAYRMGVNMDPMSRKMLEQVYTAIYDAGVNPEYLSGKKVGVYIGTCLSESEKVAFYAGVVDKTGLGIAGCSKSMFANRVSYWLNAKGPSLSIDGGCCSSAVALEQAYQALTRGDCEAAVVAACNLCLHPQTSIHFSRSMPLSMTGKTKSYDQSADGCVRSEAINVLFLQKAKDAVRIYGDVVYAKTKYISRKNAGSWKRETGEVTTFLKEFYDDIKISPRDVEYVEGFGAGDPDTDKTELNAIDNIFCGSRTEPLHVGSVMSNIGYSESATGIASVTKVLLGYHTGQLAGNLHCSQPRQDVAALRDGRINILQDHKPTARSYVAVNGLSVTGLNSHVLLHGHYKPKDLTQYECSIPRLVLLSSRTDSGVQNIIDYLKGQPIDAEELALLQNIHSSKVNGHLGRGFTILDTDNESKTTSLYEMAEYFDGNSRPLWFVYSGMGSQWAGMGAQLMRVPIFAAAIERCRQALEPKGIDIVHIITSPDKTIFDNILHSFVGIAAVQIGLTDVLLELGLVPEKIIGHSVGELGCAYADGCLTAEEMILSAYSRGLVSVQTPFIRGSMAAVGIGFEEVSKICPPEIEVACHNATDSSTISGPADIMAQFVAELTAKEIFAKEVPCSNIAYHSRYIAEAGPGLLKYLKEVIKTPKLRSERWVSTSVPQERWEEEAAKYSSAEYHTNNLLSPVLFEETSRLIPKNAVLVEVAPHGLLQAILKRAFSSCAHVPLTRRAHPDNARFLLEALGHLFMEGYYPDIRVLYPKVEFPVSTGTPHLSHLVEWAHQEIWPYPQFRSAERIASSSCTYRISLHDDEYVYLREHRIGGKTLFPFTTALLCAWDTLAMVVRANRREVSVRFQDVVFYSQPTLHDSRLLKLTVALHRGNGRFEIDDGITKVVSGYILLFEDEKKRKAKMAASAANAENNKSTENAENGENVENAENANTTENAETVENGEDTKNANTIEDAENRLNVKNAENTNTTENESVEKVKDAKKAENDENFEDAENEDIEEPKEDVILDKEEVYQILNESGYMYQDVYQSIREIGGSLTTGLISWTRWETFLDGLLQFHALRHIAGSQQEARAQPAFIRDIIIDVDDHVKAVEKDTDVKVKVCTVTENTRCGGVSLTGIKYRQIPKSEESSLVFDTTKFDPKYQVGKGFNSGNEENTNKEEILKISRVSDPDSLHWVEKPASNDAGIPVKVHYAGLNASDIIKANEPSDETNSPDESDFGMDFSGTTADGTRVMGVVAGGAASSTVRVRPELLWPAPALWSLEDAATVPFAYAHALYCLAIKTHLMPGSKILVSGGAGATGMAMIALALHCQCRVFVVLDDARKKSLLLKMFPKLNADNIFCCRDNSFVGRVLLATNGRGCNYVICSSGHLKDAYIECCGNIGCVLDIHRVKRNENFIFKLGALNWDRSYMTVDFTSLFHYNDISTFKRLQVLLAQGIAEGWVVPLPRVSYEPRDAARAFRLLARGSHRGRVLLRVDTSPTPDTRLLCPEGCHLVIADAPRLAARLADRLVRRGARSLCLRLANESLPQKLQEWQKSGVNIKTSSEDLSRRECASNLLKQSLSLGPVEGVFIVVSKPLTNKTRGIYKNLLANLDEKTRQMCPSLKYFAVIGVNNAIGEQVCVSRAAAGLPAMMLSVSIDTKIAGTLPASYGAIINAAEQGLHTTQPIIFARYPPEESISKQIKKITGVNLQDKNADNQTLQDLGVTKDKAQELSMFFRNKQNVTFLENDVQLLTIERLREIVETLEESEYAKVEGLNVFFPFVDADELIATIDAVVMPTLTLGSDMRDDEFDGREACLYIVPGMLGMHQRYSALCERLRLAAVVLQPGYDHLDETLQEMTARYVTMFLKKKGETNKFHLLGHEFGVLSVFGIAAALEDQGMTGTVYCLGGGPDEFLNELERQMRAACGGADTEIALQETVARHMCALMGVASPDLDAALRDAPTWPLKVEASVRLLRGKVAHSMQYARLQLQAAYSRVTKALKYARPAPRALKSRVVLLRSAEYAPADSSYLQRYSLQPLVVHELRAPFAHVADDLRAAPIINRYLDEEALECFANKTLCHTYLMNPDAFFQNSKD